MNGHRHSKTQRVSTCAYCMKCTASLAPVPLYRATVPSMAVNALPRPAPSAHGGAHYHRTYGRRQMLQKKAARAVDVPGLPTNANNPATPAPAIASTPTTPERGARRAPPNSLSLCCHVDHSPMATPPSKTTTFQGRESSQVGLKKVTGNGLGKTEELSCGMVAVEVRSGARVGCVGAGTRPVRPPRQSVFLKR